MIISRAPSRITLGGGGTDLPPYPSLLDGGFTVSAAITRYVYIVANRSSFDDRILVKLRRKNADAELLSDLEDDDFMPARAALEYAGINRDIELIFLGDMSGGTGLGISSAYLVNLMNVLHYYAGIRLNPKELAEAAACVEIEKLGRPIGKQDHYMAAFGGIKALWFNADGSVKVENTPITQETIDGLRNSLLLFYTGQRRQSGIILGEQKRLAESGDKLVTGYYRDVKELGLRIFEALKSGDLVEFGELMHEQWMKKRKLPGGVSNPEFDRIYEAARNNGAVGGKLVGAGGGGCFVFLVDPLRKKRLRDTMATEGLEEKTFDFDFSGAQLLTTFVERHEAIMASQLRSSER